MLPCSACLSCLCGACRLGTCFGPAQQSWQPFSQHLPGADGSGIHEDTLDTLHVRRYSSVLASAHSAPDCTCTWLQCISVVHITSYIIVVHIMHAHYVAMLLCGAYYIRIVVILKRSCLACR